MKIIDILNSPPCKKIFDEVTDFAGRYLKEYTDTIESNGFSRQDKDIFDTVWGSIELSAVEICILDSPLLQRLRNIHQLGLVSLVYCGADYSRFSHTLGVIEISGRMASVVSKKIGNNNSAYSFCEIVRIAALFHDVGHMFFSHISEHFFSKNEKFSRYNEINNMLIHFKGITSANISLHELLSVMIVNSNETKRLINVISKYFEKSRITEGEDLEQFIEYISCLIIGTPIDRNILPYSTIINGPIDADKLDYLSRDSYCTKVPIAVDISRLIQKIDVVSVKEVVRSSIWNENPHVNTTLYKMALKHSAQRAFWQLSMARSIMFESLYFHQKVLTAETMLRNVFEKVLSLINDEQKNFSFLLSLTDDIFNEHLDLILIPPEKQKQEETNAVLEIIKQIKNRDLYKRVASFSQDTVTGSSIVIDGFLTDIIEHPDEEKYMKFQKEMTDEYKEIRRILKKREIGKLPEFMFVEYPGDKVDRSKMDIPIEYGNGHYKMSSEVFQNEIWMQSKETRQKQHYFVTDQTDRNLVLFAFEKVLLVKYNIHLKYDASMCAKFSDEHIYKNKTQLFEAGYYDNTLTLISDEMIWNLIDRNTFDIVVKKFQSYDGVNNTKVTVETLFSYLKQYMQLQCNKNNITIILDGVLRILKNATFIDREFFVKNVASLLVKIQQYQYKNNIIIKLGGIFDSGAHLSYYFNDIKDKEKFIFPETIDAAFSILRDCHSLIFFDDGAYSGRQVVSIFQEMMGVPIEKRATKEKHVSELSSENKDKLKKSNLILSYLCFNPNSEEYIKFELKNIGIQNVTIVYINSLNQKVFDDDSTIFKNPEQKNLTKKYLYEIGQKLLHSTKYDKKIQYKDGWDEDRVKKSAIGYNDAQQTVIFESNVPTYTITALWANGKYNGYSWKGLFQRTDKD